MRSQRRAIHPCEAAALDRLLDAYLAAVDPESDPGFYDLVTLRSRVQHWEQDHSLYEAGAARLLDVVRTTCGAGQDGECYADGCVQRRDGEPDGNSLDPKVDGCCPDCGGSGVSEADVETNGGCWTCRGTGHPHEGPCEPETGHEASEDAPEAVAGGAVAPGDPDEVQPQQDGLRVEVSESRDRPARCKVWRDGVLVFDGVSNEALMRKRKS